MNILGILGKSRADNQLVNYTISLFEGWDKNSIDNTSLLNVHIKKTDLLVITIEKIEELQTLDLDLTKGKPVFLVSTSPIDKAVYKSLDMDICETYYLPDVEANFDNEQGLIAPTRLRLELIKKVNQIRYNKLKIVPRTSSCGIERSDIECGDESDY